MKKKKPKKKKKQEKRSKEFKKIIECAKEVYKILGSGFIESVYGEALAIEFRKRKIHYEKERNTELFYKREKVGVGTQDFIIDKNFVVELKATTRISTRDESQLRSYLVATSLKKGVIVNFVYPPVDEQEFKEVKLKI